MFSLLLFLLVSIKGESQECFAIDGRSTIYDGLCGLLPREVKLEVGCNAGNQPNCRFCRPNECSASSISLPMNLFEGDILLINKTVTDFLAEHVQINGEITRILESILIEEDVDPLLVLRNALRDKKRSWPNGFIPYRIDSVFSSEEYNVIISAMREIERSTCIRFKQRDPAIPEHANYVNIIKGDGCYSLVGLYGRGEQPLSLGDGCIYKGTAMHEMMHALGFFHEQSRTDRDNYIKVNWDNIISGTEGNFLKYTQEQIDHLGESYDYFSLLHYTRIAFSKNGNETITPLQNVELKHSAVKDVPTKTDIAKINKLYDCNNNCQDKIEYCASWKKAGYCSDDIFMQLACSVSCFNKCPTHECKDFQSQCNWWVTSNPSCSEYLRIVCPLSCRQC